VLGRQRSVCKRSQFGELVASGLVVATTIHGHRTTHGNAARRPDGRWPAHQ
jgi:hypothetical protein